MNQMFALMCPQRGLWTGGVNIRRPSAATALGSTKTFHFLIPTTAGEVGMNTWCGGYRTTTWQGYYYGGGTTAMTALVSGTPQLVIPQEDYQAACCRPITDVGGGILLELGKETAENIAQGCQEILGDAAYRQRTQTLADEVATLPPPSAVVQTLEQRIAR